MRLALVLLIAIGGFSLHPAAASAARSPKALHDVVAPDGSLRATSGSFDASGYRMTLAADGSPRFSTAAATGADAGWSSRFGNPGLPGYSLSAVAVRGRDVYVGGSFDFLNSDSPQQGAKNVAHFDGRGWSALGTAAANGTNGLVRALAVAEDGTVYAGGDFTSAGGRAANRVARFRNGAWSGLGTGLTSASSTPARVEALAVAGTKLYVGGQFDKAGTVAANSVAAWNGTAWSALGGGVTTCLGCGTPTPGRVQALLATSDGRLYAGGDFERAGIVNVGSLALYSGGRWTKAGGADVKLQTGYGVVTALAMSPTGALAIGGTFDAVGTVSASGVAQLIGGRWYRLGAGVNTWGNPGGVTSLAYQGASLIVGGTFTDAGGTGREHLARWNAGAWSAPGGALNGAVQGLASLPTGAVVAVGAFAKAGTMTLNRVGTWTGTEWLPLGIGVSVGDSTGHINALAISGHDVYAAGSFLSAGGVAVQSVAKLQAGRWTPMAGGMPGIYDVRAIAIDGPRVYVGGGFSSAGGVAANNIAMWDGRAWHALGGGLDGIVRALTMYKGKLWAGGDFFYTVDGNRHGRLAKYDPAAGAWRAVALNWLLDDGVYSLAGVPGAGAHELIVGGKFRMLTDHNTGNKYPMNGVARLDVDAAPNAPLAGYRAMGGGLDGGNGHRAAYALYAEPTAVWVGGDFATAGGVTSPGFARYALGTTTTPWTGTGGVAGGLQRVNAITKAGTSLYVGGDFTNVGTGALPAASVARYTAGTGWSALGSGLLHPPGTVSGAVNALAQGMDGLYAGGEITQAGGQLSQNIAHWTPTATVGDLGLTQAIGANPRVGVPTTVAVAVANAVAAASPAARLTVTLPAGATIGGVTTSQGTCTTAGATVTCALGPIAGKATATVNVTVTPAATGLFTARAAVTPTDGTADNATSAVASVKR